MITEKYCGKCDKVKPISNFGSDRKRKYGLTSACKACRNPQSKAWRDKNKEYVKEINKKSRDKRKEYYSDPERMLKYRNLELKRKFGITHEQYEKILAQQKGICAICKKFRLNKGKKYMAIDHCHKSGKIRGILCHFCNRGLGSFEDSQDFLINAIKYLARE